MNSACPLLVGIHPFGNLERPFGPHMIEQEFLTLPPENGPFKGKKV